MRISMNMKTVFSFLIVLFLVSSLNITTSFAQDFPRWGLPDGARARLGKGTINGIAYSPDGSRLAVGGSIGIWVYDADTGTEVALIGGYTGWVNSVSFSPDGNTIVSGGRHQAVRFWDAATGNLINTLEHGRRNTHVLSVAYSPDGTTIASGGSDGTVQLWNAATGNLINTLRGHTGDVYSVAFSPDGTTIAGTGEDSTVRLWDTATGNRINTLTGHTDRVYSVAYSPDGTTIASAGRGGNDATLRLWDTATGNLINTLTVRGSAVQGSDVHSVAFSPDGTTIASGYASGTVCLWDTTTGNLINTLTVPARTYQQFVSGVYNSLVYSPDGTTIAGGIFNDDLIDSFAVQLWDTATGNPINKLRGHTGWPESVTFSPDGTTIASGASWDGILRLWDTATGILIKTLERRGGVNSVAYSPDGTTIAVGSQDNVYLLDANTGTLINILEHRYSVYSVAFSPDGTTLASGGRDGTVRLWDTATGTLIKSFIGHTDSVTNVAYSPDGTTLASGSWDGTVRLWDTATGTLIKTLEHRRAVESVAFSPDGTTLASGDTNGLYLWDANTGNRINTLRTISVKSVAFSPNGNTIASGSGGYNVESYVHLWDANTGTLIKSFIGHIDSATNVAYSPDGATLASGSGDGTVLLWRLTPTTAPLTFTPSTVADQTFTVGTPVNLTLPTATGGTPPYTYSLAPPLPVGLYFDPIADGPGYIGGTPTTATSATPVTYTATDAIGTTASLTFTITVMDAAPADITFIPNAIDDLTLTINIPMEPMYLPFAEGGTPPYTYTLDPIPVGLSFDAAIQQLSGTPTTVGTTTATYTATDASGASGSLTFSIEVVEDGTVPVDPPSDVNRDGQVTVIDLAIVALFYGTRVPVGVSLPADVNADGIVDLADLTAVAQGIDAAGGGLNQLAPWEVEAALFAAVEQAAEIAAVAGAPMGFGTHVSSGGIASKNVAAALADVRQMMVGDVRLGKELAVLSELLQLLAEMTTTPETTALLANYPNPFNPETWIPYHLAKDAEVKLTIYDMRGVAVRELILGHQAAGVYQSRGRAAYWDGRNQHGEPVASGVYFYTLTAGEFTATRKMLIRK